MNLSSLIPSGYIQVGTRAFWSTATFTAPKAGIAVVTLMGGGASGCKTSRPGNSAPWGVKIVKLAANDVLNFMIAGAVAGSAGTSTAGASSQLQLNSGGIMVANGGEGNASTSTFAAVAATVAGADFVMMGRQPQGTFAYGAGGGAAVDLGYGTINPTVTGGDWSITYPGSTPALGAPVGAYIPAFDLTVISDPVSNGGSSTVTYPGIGSSTAPRVATLFGGGNGQQDSGTAYPAGRGGSGGTNTGTAAAAPGGAGYGYLRFLVKA